MSDKIFFSWSYVFRLCGFLFLYSGIHFLLSDFTHAVYAYRVTFSDLYPFLVFPVFLLLFSLFRRREIFAFFRAGSAKPKFFHICFFSLLAVFFFSFPSVLRGVDGGVNVHPFLFGIHYFQLVFANFFLFLAVFGWPFLKRFFFDFLLIFCAIVLSLLTHILVESQWELFSGFIISSLAILFSFFNFPFSFEVSTFAFQVEHFRVFIGPACAGFLSLATFLYFFVVSVLLFRHGRKIDFLKALLFLFLGLGALFLFNILRVAIILLVGVYISPDLAMNLFHEYLASFFLLGIIIFYLYRVIPRIYRF